MLEFIPLAPSILMQFYSNATTSPSSLALHLQKTTTVHNGLYTMLLNSRNESPFAYYILLVLFL